MKIFDSAPGIVLERPPRRFLAFAAAATTAVLVAVLGGALFYQGRAHASELAKAKADLDQATSQASTLKGQLATANGKLATMVSASSTCSSDLAAETGKVAAFAKQAAACEAIRTKLHVKD